MAQASYNENFDENLNGEDLASFFSGSLDDFDTLWNISQEEAESFHSSKRLGSKANYSDNEEIVFLRSKVKEKEYLVKKLNWQLTTRQKELENLYAELEHTLEQNQKLNEQFEEYKVLEREYQQLVKLGKGLSNTMAELQEENTRLKEELKDKAREARNKPFIGWLA